LGYEPRNLGDLVGRESRSGHLVIASHLTELASQVARTRGSRSRIGDAKWPFARKGVSAKGLGSHYEKSRALNLGEFNHC
jgi:hypothetical protein